MLLELTLYARKLKDVVGAFKGTSDPFAVVTKMASGPGESAVGTSWRSKISKTHGFAAAQGKLALVWKDPKVPHVMGGHPEPSVG